MRFNEDALQTLATHALVWAKTYCSLVEALLAQGVMEEDARAEARITAMVVASVKPEEQESWQTEGGTCPLCGERS